MPAFRSGWPREAVARPRGAELALERRAGRRGARRRRHGGRGSRGARRRARAAGRGRCRRGRLPRRLPLLAGRGHGARPRRGPDAPSRARGHLGRAPRRHARPDRPARRDRRARDRPTGSTTQGVGELLVVHDHDLGYGVPVAAMCAGGGARDRAARALPPRVEPRRAAGRRPRPARRPCSTSASPARALPTCGGSCHVARPGAVAARLRRRRARPGSPSRWAPPRRRARASSSPCAPRSPSTASRRWR